MPYLLTDQPKIGVNSNLCISLITGPKRSGGYLEKTACDSLFRERTLSFVSIEFWISPAHPQLGRLKTLDPATSRTPHSIEFKSYVRKVSIIWRMKAFKGNTLILLATD